MKPAIERLELNQEELQRVLEHARPALPEAKYRQLKAALDTLVYVLQGLEIKNMTIQRLRQLVFGARTEKSAKVLKTLALNSKAEDLDGRGAGSPHTDTEVVPQGKIPAEQHSERRGHGRNGAQAYSGAQKIKIEHPSLKSGDRCPECKTGKLYAAATPGLLVRIVGQAPLAATVYEREKLRCNLCGEVFTAAVPEGLGAKKYDTSAASMKGWAR